MVKIKRELGDRVGAISFWDLGLFLVERGNSGWYWLFSGPRKLFQAKKVLKYCIHKRLL